MIDIWVLIISALHVRPKQTQDVESMLIYCWAIICDAGPTLTQLNFPFSLGAIVVMDGTY